MLDVSVGEERSHPEGRGGGGGSSADDDFTTGLHSNSCFLFTSESRIMFQNCSG